MSRQWSLVSPFQDIQLVHLHVKPPKFGFSMSRQFSLAPPCPRSRSPQRLLRMLGAACSPTALACRALLHWQLCSTGQHCSQLASTKLAAVHYIGSGFTLEGQYTSSAWRAPTAPADSRPLQQSLSTFTRVLRGSFTKDRLGSSDIMWLHPLQEKKSRYQEV